MAPGVRRSPPQIFENGPHRAEGCPDPLVFPSDHAELTVQRRLQIDDGHSRYVDAVRPASSSADSFGYVLFKLANF